MSTSHNFDYDVLVIGTGPGGEGAAMQATKGGLRVATVERYASIGGGCTHWGTIPSKALRHAITSVTEALNSPVVRQAGVHVNLTLQQLHSNTQTIISRQVALRQSFYDRNAVPVIVGQARFLDEHTVHISGARDTTVTADKFVIAVGSRPYHPKGINFDQTHVFDSDTILKVDGKPRTMTVYGAGVIGCEYASMFRNLGIKVNLINTRSKLLEFLDDEIIDALAYHMRDQGIVIRHDETFDRLDVLDDGVVMHLKSGKRVKSDLLLWANGRQGNTDDLGLENVGLEPNSRGQLEVDQQFQTRCDHIYAVGDVIGFPSLASAAYTQGRAASQHILGNVDAETNLRITTIPTGIYTSPEISSIGKNERELTQECVPYEVGSAQFKSLARAQITGNTAGMLKILFHRETRAILGVHCFGAQASEIIHIGQAIMNQPEGHNKIDYFFNSTFNYPTMAEAYRVAALNGHNRLF